MAEREPDQTPIDEMNETTPGSEGLVDSPEPGQGQFQEAYDLADDQVAAVGSIKRDDEDEPAEVGGEG